VADKEAFLVVVCIYEPAGDVHQDVPLSSHDLFSRIKTTLSWLASHLNALAVDDLEPIVVAIGLELLEAPLNQLFRQGSAQQMMFDSIFPAPTLVCGIQVLETHPVYWAGRDLRFQEFPQDVFLASVLQTSVLNPGWCVETFGLVAKRRSSSAVGTPSEFETLYLHLPQRIIQRVAAFDSPG